MLAFVRLENTDENHNKFYEMAIVGANNNALCDIKVRYGRISTQGKTIYLHDPSFSGGEAKSVFKDEAVCAFLRQLKKKFKNKEYVLMGITTNSEFESLKGEVENLQSEFECFTKTAERLEDRGF